MKLEKLMKALSQAFDQGIPDNCEIRDIETVKINGLVESIHVIVEKGNEQYTIHTSWQTD